MTSTLSRLTIRSWFTSVKLVNSGSFLRFQPDTGAQCDVIPTHLYKQACNDEDLSHDRSMKSTIALTSVIS